MLDRAAELVAEREDDLAMTIAAEAGKPVKTARVEAQRCVSTLTFSAVAARTLTGHTVPMEAGDAGEGKLGIVIRVPYGVVGAISPFNFPLNLVAHKLGPAIAAGNASSSSPPGRRRSPRSSSPRCSTTPACPRTGCRSSAARAPRSATRSSRTSASARSPSPARRRSAGASARRSPHKKVNLELGSTAPLIVNDDGDWETAADKAKLHAFSHAGQSCISVQRILLHESIADEFTKRFVANVESLVTGDPMDENTDVGPLISRDDRDRVKQWVDEAAEAGAEMLTGGELVDEDRCLAPDRDQGRPAPSATPGRTRSSARWRRSTPSRPSTRRSRWRTTPVTACRPASSPRDVGRAIKAGETLEFGGVLINEVPTFRTDQMPYGGVKDSGNTREGPALRHAELTEERLVSFQG